MAELTPPGDNRVRLEVTAKVLAFLGKLFKKVSRAVRGAGHAVGRLVRRMGVHTDAATDGG
jgi:hypothetical protein